MFMPNFQISFSTCRYDYEEPDSAFERPPAVIALERINANPKKFPTQRFIIISVHIKPEVGAADMVTEDEIDKLKVVYEEALEKFPDIKDCIIAGDMNADGSYVKDPEALKVVVVAKHFFSEIFSCKLFLKSKLI